MSGRSKLCSKPLRNAEQQTVVLRHPSIKAVLEFFILVARYNNIPPRVASSDKSPFDFNFS